MKTFITSLSVFGVMVTLLGVNVYGQSTELKKSTKSTKSNRVTTQKVTAKKSVTKKPVKYDPCSSKNYRKNLLSNQEAGALNKYKAHCAKKNPNLARAYRAVENSVRAEKALPAGYSVRHANQQDCDRMTPAITAEINNLQDQVKLQRVKSINAFRGAGADVDNLVPQVGQIRLLDVKYNEPINCNTPFVETSDGLKGFMLPKHCIKRESSGEWYDHLSNMKIHMGFDSDNPERVIDVESSFCTKRDGGDDGTMLCLLIPKPYSGLANMQPLKINLKSESSFREDIELGRDIYLAGYHPSRTMAEHGELYDSYGAGPYPPQTTRTTQVANRVMLPAYRSFTNGRGTALLAYDGDTLDMSSGTAVLDWNYQNRQYELAGIHVKAGIVDDDDEKNENFNLSILYPDDQFVEFTSAADQPAVR